MRNSEEFREDVEKGQAESKEDLCLSNNWNKQILVSHRVGDVLVFIESVTGRSI